MWQPRLEIALLPGAAELLERHALELPQRDDLCGAFCGALALQAAGVRSRDGEELDQDAVASAAGSVVAQARPPGVLPDGETGRRDYRLELPMVADPDLSGTTCEGIVQALNELSGGTLAAIPYRGPWNETTLDGLFELALARAAPTALLANLATRYLWGGRASLALLLSHLLSGEQDGPPPDWDVGHFACVIGRVRGPGGTLYGLADTYPALGSDGIHMQPRGRLAAAIERREMPAGGVIVVLASEEAGAVRAGASELGLVEGTWDNGTVAAAR